MSHLFEGGTSDLNLLAADANTQGLSASIYEREEFARPASPEISYDVSEHEVLGSIEGAESSRERVAGSSRERSDYSGQHASVTVIMKNIPNAYSRDQLLDLFDQYGFRGFYDFFHVPADFAQRANLGYCVINLVDRAAYERFKEVFEGFSQWDSLSEKVCELVESKDQGLRYHVERYRNSGLMHPAVPDRFKPARFQNGQRIPFPAPSQRLRPPHAFCARK